MCVWGRMKHPGTGPQPKGRNRAIAPPKFLKTYVFVRYSNKLHHFAPAENISWLRPCPGMLSVWGCHLLVTKGRTLKIRQQKKIVVQMCTALLLIACCGRIVSLEWVGRFLCFLSNVLCTSFASALNLRLDLILDEGGLSELVRTSNLQHCAQSCFYFAYFIEVLRSCRSYRWSPFSIIQSIIEKSITVYILNVCIVVRLF